MKRLAHFHSREESYMRQSKGKKTKYPGVYSLGEGSFRIVAKAIDPRTKKPKFKERVVENIDVNEAVAFRAELIKEIESGASASGAPMDIPRLATLCGSSWITFLVANVERVRAAKLIGEQVEQQLLPRWGDYFIDRIEIAEIDAWVRELESDYVPTTVRRFVGLLRRILAKARGQYGLPPLDWSLVSLPKVTDEHARKNRLPPEDIAKALQVIEEEFPFYAPFFCTMFSTGLRYCHVAAMRWAKLSSAGIVTLDEAYEYKTQTFVPISARKRAPGEIRLEPYTLELVRQHRKSLMRDAHPGLKSGLLFPAEQREGLPISNQQVNTIWKRAQNKAGLSKLITAHGVRHTFHDVARKRDVDVATVKAMAGHTNDARHFLYSQGVDVDERAEASRRVMTVVLGEGCESRDVSRDASNENSCDDEKSQGTAEL
ncbi:MAG: tyrosine-type recombinase/integrase [Deltaproteobacteria bacterium]|nr:tyrosine-type recombinase/integrase [Deltaproteobacteria bacterium]